MPVLRHLTHGDIVAFCDYVIMNMSSAPRLHVHNYDYLNDVAQFSHAQSSLF